MTYTSSLHDFCGWALYPPLHLRASNKPISCQSLKDAKHKLTSERDERISALGEIRAQMASLREKATESAEMLVDRPTDRELSIIINSPLKLNEIRLLLQSRQPEQYIEEQLASPLSLQEVRDLALPPTIDSIGELTLHPQNLRPVTLESEGWRDARVISPSDYGDEPCRHKFWDSFEVSELGNYIAESFEDSITRIQMAVGQELSFGLDEVSALEMASSTLPRFGLSTDWRLAEILRALRALPAVGTHGSSCSSVLERVIQIVSGLEIALHYVHPNLSCASKIAFLRSFEVEFFLYDFAHTYAETDHALQLAGNSGNASTQVSHAYAVTTRCLELYSEPIHHGISLPYYEARREPEEGKACAAAAGRRSIRREVNAFRKVMRIRTNKEVAKKLRISESGLKSMMTHTGKVRYGPQRMHDVLTLMTNLIEKEVGKLER